MTTQKKFYLIREDVLPESVKKTLLIKDLLDKNPKLSIFDAVKKHDLSRSAYYKYKDFIKPFFEGSQEKIFNIHMSLKDRQGLLAQILEVIADDKMNILTIVQNAAVDGIVQLTISLQGTAETPKNIETTLAKIQLIDGVRDLRILGSNS